MHRLILLLVLALPGSAASQPSPEGTPRLPSAQQDARPHLYGELFGASFFGVSLNLEQPLGQALAVRGGIGALPELFGTGVHLTVIGGLLYLPGDGAYRPELGVTASVASQLDRALLTGPYLGVRYHAANGSVVRFGANVFIWREREGWSVAPWPAISFGGRL